MPTVPAESEPHARTWMAWPSTPDIYGGAGVCYESVQKTLGRLAGAHTRDGKLAARIAEQAGAEHHGAGLCGEGGGLDYGGNGALYTPMFGDRKADALAVDVLGRLHPDRRIVQLEVDRIYENGGGIHCVTQQQPQ